MELRHNSGTAMAYLAGVLHGDGFSTDRAFGLHVKDLDFAETFALAVREVSTAIVKPSPDRGRYWRVVLRGTQCFAEIKSYLPQNEAETAAWIRGLFDSEGSAFCTPTKRWKNSYSRRVSIFSTDEATLCRAKTLASAIGIESEIIRRKTTAGHLGTKPVFEFRLAHDRDNFTRFAWLVGSSVTRKTEILRRIPLTFSIDLQQSMRDAQKLGAAARRRKTLEVTLPTVLDGIRQLINTGLAPTQRNCLDRIPKYGSVVSIFGTKKLAEMASGRK